MKFQNLLGMFSVLLIALSGPSYASGYVSPPASPPSATPTTPLPSTIPFTPSTIPFTPSPADTIAPTVLGPEGTESNCGGSVESCKKEGEDRGSSLAKKVIIEIVEMELLDAVENGKDREKDFPQVDEYRLFAPILLAQILSLLDDPRPLWFEFALTEPEKVLIKLAAQRAEFSLRTIIKRLLKSARNPNCDDNCKAYNEAKIDEVDDYHRDLVYSLNDADIPLLQSRIPG